MGIETIAIVGLSLFQADAQLRAAEEAAEAQIAQSEREAAALIEQTDNQNRERLKRIRATADRQTVSFLNSGINLEGGPQTVIAQTLQTGQEDIALASRNAATAARNIQQSARANASNILNNARSEAIGSLVPTAVGFGTGMDFGMGDTFDIAGDLRGINVPFTGSGPTFSPQGTIIPPSKPTRINF